MERLGKRCLVFNRVYTFYGQLAFTNGSNASFGGISYNNSGQYMQFETASSEWMRLGSNGNLLIGTTTDSGYKLDVTGTGRFTSTLLVSGAATFSSTVNVNGATATTNLNILGVAGTMVGTTATNQQLRITAPTTTANAGAGIRFDASSGAHEATANIGIVNNASGNLGSLVFNVYNGGSDFPEHMRIFSGGNVSIGTSSDLFYKLNIYSPDLNNTAGTCTMKNGANNGGGYFVLFQNYLGGTAGVIQQLTATSILYNSSSDYRLKEDILPMQNAIDRILKIKPVTYKWKNTEDEYGEGFIAHELQEIVPMAVGGEKDDMNKDGTIKPQGIDYGKLTPLLVAAIQEQNKIIEDLKTRLDNAGL
jgi:hypothetical protein